VNKNEKEETNEKSIELTGIERTSKQDYKEKKTVAMKSNEEGRGNLMVLTCSNNFDRALFTYESLL
jgi:hypothetical protein